MVTASTLKVWPAWCDAWMNKKPFKAEKIAYMLTGDTGE
jgi:hypothetical protein